MTVELNGEHARVGDPRHGWIDVERDALMAGMRIPPAVLVKNIEARGATRVKLNGKESHVTLAALDAPRDTADNAKKTAPIAEHNGVVLHGAVAEVSL